MSAYRRAAAVQWLRLRRDGVLLACVLGGLLPTAAFVLAVPGPDALAGSAAAARTQLGSAAVDALLQAAVLSAAAFGALRTATDFANGVLARDVLSLGPRPALLARLAGGAVAGGVVGIATVALGMGWLLLVGVRPDASALTAALPAGLWGGGWGVLAGSVVRTPLYVLFGALAPLTAGALVTADGLAERMPLRALQDAFDAQPASAAVAVVWLLALSGLAAWTGRRRGLL